MAGFLQTLVVAPARESGGQQTMGADSSVPHKVQLASELTDQLTASSRQRLNMVRAEELKVGMRVPLRTGAGPNTEVATIHFVGGGLVRYTVPGKKRLQSKPILVFLEWM